MVDARPEPREAIGYCLRQRRRHGRVPAEESTVQDAHRSRVLEAGTEAPDSVPLQRPRKSREAGAASPVGVAKREEAARSKALA